MVIENLLLKEALMLDSQLLQSIKETSDVLGLKNTVIEKDYYVTQLIHTLSHIKSDYFELVFCGGTCLAKAHRIAKRMSEDIDFKIQTKEAAKNLSKTQFLKELKKFRLHIASTLTNSGLSIANSTIRNEGQYSQIALQYLSTFPLTTTLRPHILLEFTVSDIRLPTENLSINTLIEDTLKNIILFDAPETSCVSVNETAIEKWVGLTRRIIAIERTYHADDKTLIRHVYDLNAINHANNINSDFFELAKIIIHNDAQQFKNQHPEYATDPAAEIKQSLTLLKNKTLWKERYQEFIETMVYDNNFSLEYDDAIKVLGDLSNKIINSLEVLES